MKIFEYETGKVYVEGWMKEQLQLESDVVKIDVNEEEELKKKIRFELNCDKEFVLVLNLSECCKNFETRINGELIVNLSRDGIVKFDKAWKTGDVLELVLKLWD